jgi:hypothetical protein
MAFQLIKAEAQDDSAQRWSQFAHKFVDAATRGDAFCLETAADVVAMVGEMGRLRRELAQAREQEQKALERQGDMETKVEGLKKTLQVSPLMPRPSQHRSFSANMFLQEAQDALAKKTDEEKAVEGIEYVIKRQNDNHEALESRTPSQPPSSRP